MNESAPTVDDVIPVKAPTYNLRGANKEFYLCKDHEKIISGPSDCGKTVAAGLLCHVLATKYPKARGLMTRKVYASMRTSVIQTFNKIVSGRNVGLLGGDTSPQVYIYPNSSRIWIAGMDKPEKILSAEYDFAYVNQAEQFELNDWEMLSSRVTGRAGNIPHPMLFGDCNPGPRRHWIKLLEEAGSLRLFAARHIDNPSLFNEDGSFVNEQAEIRINKLKSLTGIRRKRFFEGLWVSAEGAVFDTFNPNEHVLVRPTSEMRRWMIAVDIGYTNPTAVLLIGIDNDGRWHIFKEYYATGLLPTVVTEQVRKWYVCEDPKMKAEGFANCEMVACDDAAAGAIAEMKNSGVYVRGGKGKILDGVYRIQNRLAIAGDGKPRLSIDPSCEETINEFESHEWEKDKSTGKLRDVPKDEFNHSIKAIAYLAHVLGEPTGAFHSVGTAATGGGNPSMPEPRVFVPRHFTPRHYSGRADNKIDK